MEQLEKNYFDNTFLYFNMFVFIKKLLDNRSFKYHDIIDRILRLLVDIMTTTLVSV